MRYQGSKSKFATALLETILPYRGDSQIWVEPFVGSCSVTKHVEGERIASDNNPYLIGMWKALQCGWIPPDEVSEELYNSIKSNRDSYAPELVAFAGFCCSFGGKWFGGYARYYEANSTDGRKRNFANESARALLREKSALDGVNFSCNSYRDLEIPPNSFIYCDPPYAHTTGYHSKFDSSRFWSWVREQSRIGHLVFTSEYNAPSDFRSMWELNRTSHMSKGLYDITYTEKVFVWEGQNETV